MDESLAADQPHSMATPEAQDLQGDADGGSAARVTQNADGGQVETATTEFGEESEYRPRSPLLLYTKKNFFVSSNGLPSENALNPPTRMETHNASQSILSTSDLPADETTSVNENTMGGEEEEGGNEDGEWLDILGNGLLMKKVSHGIDSRELSVGN